METDERKTKELLLLALAVCGVFITLFVLVLFNGYLLQSFQLLPRMVLGIAAQWLLFLAPGMLMLARKERIQDFGFTKRGRLKQILTGVCIALAMSAILTVIPILLGLRDMIGSTNYTRAWQFAYEFVYAVAGVALAEELVFRGYIFNKLLLIAKSKWWAIIISSVLFGLLHVFGGNPIQLLLTALIGMLFCLCRERIKGCTMLSLIIAHGVYDALIVLWSGIL